MNHTANGKPSFSITIHELVAVTAISATFLAVTTAVYEWGFLISLGVSLDEINLSVSDITSGIVRRVPALCIIALATAALMFVIQSPISESKNPSERRSINKEKFYLYAIYALNFLLFAMFGNKFSSGVVFACINIFTDIFYKLFNTPMFSKLNYWILLFARWSIAIICIMYYVGYTDGESTEKSKERTSTIYLSDNVKFSGRVVRSYESGYLVLKDGLVFLPKEVVIRIDMPPKEKLVGIPCYAANLLCPER